MNATTAPARTPGVISAGEAYTIAEFRRRSGLGDYAFREARRAGLRIVAVGKKRFILGSDWIAFLIRQSDDQVSTGNHQNGNAA